ncbi:MAG: DbpA RNA binding domain-containing protein, partial [Rhodocyclales bacterium]|nr:DbpA RNA binding domain-containing protein [Rhodocyclales bacterium]
PAREERPARDERPAREERPRREFSEPRAFNEDKPRPNRDEILARRRDFASGALAKFRIDVGRNQGVTPKDIVGAIANEGGIEGKHIGQIHLFDDYSTVELPSGLPAEVFDLLKRTRIRQSPLNLRPVAAGEGEAPSAFRAKPKWGGERDDKRPFTAKPAFAKKPFDGGARPPKAPYKAGDAAKPPYRGEKKFAGKPKKY